MKFKIIFLSILIYSINNFSETNNFTERFRPPCNNETTPYLEDVELHSLTNDASIENCWSSIPSNTNSDYRWNVGSGNTPSSDTGPSSAYSGNNYFYTEASDGYPGDETELLTPTIDLSVLNTPNFKFYYHMYGYAVNSLHIDIFNNGVWTNDEIVISGQQQTSSTDNWIEYSHILNGYSNNIIVRFRAIRGNSSEGDIAIDDIQISEFITCPVPSNFTATNVGTRYVDLSWIAGDTETSWEVEYGEEGYTQGTGIINQAITNPYTLTGLDPDTNYSIYLRANCGANPNEDDSFWTESILVTTLISCEAPTNFTKSNVAETSVDLSWSSSGTEISWELQYGVHDFAIGNGTIVQANSNTYNLTGLTGSTDYDIYLRANCDPNNNDDSTWVGPIFFTTLRDYCGGQHFYDSGGPSGNYGEAEYITTSISPSEGNNVVEIVFNSFMVEDGGKLQVYDGPHPYSSELVAVLTGYEIPNPIRSTHSTGALSFVFESNYNSVASGWDATINCLNISCHNPNNFSSTNVTESEVELLWSSNNDSSTTWEIEYGLHGFTQGTGTTIYTTENTYNITDLTDNTAYDVYIRANCSEDEDSEWVSDSFITLKIIDPENLTTQVDEETGEVILNWEHNVFTAYEDFSGDNYYWEALRGNWWVYNEQLNGEASNSQGNPLLYYDQDFSNFELEVDLSYSGDCKIDIAFGDINNNFPYSDGLYLIEYCATNVRWRFSKLQNNSWTEIYNWNHTPSINSGSGEVWNTVKIVSSNGFFDIYFNNELQGTFYDNLVTIGKIGFYTMGGGLLKADNFTVKELGTAYTFGRVTQSNVRNVYSIEDDSFMRSESALIPPTRNYTYRNNNNNNLVNYNIYRDNVLIATTTETTYVDVLPSSGTYEYHVTAIYGEMETNSTNAESSTWVANTNNLSVYNFKYHPNPINNILNLSANQDITSIKIYSLLGQKMMIINPKNQSNLSLDMSNLSIGTYFMKVEIDGNISSMKLVKK